MSAVFIKKINNPHTIIAGLGCDRLGEMILKQKASCHYFLIEHLATPAAQILKQEALACGGDFALPKDAIMYSQMYYDGLLMMTQSQFKALSKKLLMQPFGLSNLAKEIALHFGPSFHEVKIMGVINVTPDSFFAPSRKEGHLACQRIEELICQGADCIDIGGASTRPGSEFVPSEVEKQRLMPLLEYIKAEQLYKSSVLSIDTYHPDIARLCLDYGFAMVNDITGFKEQMLRAIDGYDCSCVLMHMRGIPLSMQQDIAYTNLFSEIHDFFTQGIERLKQAKKQNIILDVGIGFGKNLEHNCDLIQNLNHFCCFGYPLLVGASRKSLIGQISPSQPEERLPGTLALHLRAVENGASFIRCHDVKEHVQALKVWREVSHG